MSIVLFSNRVVLVENIPEDISFLDNGTAHVPLSVGLHNLLNLATRSVEIVSPQWALNSSDYESSFLPSARQVRPRCGNNLEVISKIWNCSIFGSFSTQGS